MILVIKTTSVSVSSPSFYRHYDVIAGDGQRYIIKYDRRHKKLLDNSIFTIEKCRDSVFKSSQLIQNFRIGFELWKVVNE